MAVFKEEIAVVQKQADEVMIEQSTSGWMEQNSNLVKYNGGSEVKIPKVEMDGLADYDKTEGFVDGDVSLTFETEKLTQDRGRKFSIDENDVDESNFILTASSLIGEFQRVKVVPEVDAYRYSKIASLCVAKERATTGYTPHENTILTQLYEDIAKVTDIVGENCDLVITISTPALTKLSLSDKVNKTLTVTNFKKGSLTLKVKAIDLTPLIPVPSARMKTEYIFADGKTNGQKTGGFTIPETAKDINWIITPKKAPMAVSKTDNMRVFSPEENQSKRAYAIDYRKFHDLWITDEKVKVCWVNTN